jgi:hypothetical protein
MLSSQGVSKFIENGMFVSQTIAQLSVTGVFNNNLLRGFQGYQQPFLGATKFFQKSITKQPYAYPNPFSSSFRINIPDARLGDEVTVVVYDLNGKQLYSYKYFFLATDFLLNLEYLPSGSYLLSVSYNGNVSALQLIKNN